MHELDPGYPRANHDEVFRELGGRVSLACGDHSDAVWVGPISHPGAAARRDDDGICSQLLLSSVDDAYSYGVGAE